MKNFVQLGQQFPVPAPYPVQSGQGVLVGSIFGVAVHEQAAAGQPVEIAAVGVFDLAKTDLQAWAVGARIYWDEALKACTSVAATNKLIGVAIAAVAAGAGLTTGRVLLTAAFTL